MSNLGNTGIIGSGCYFPKKKISVDALAKTCHIDPTSLLKDHGVNYITLADPNETEEFMATEAVKSALADAKINSDKVDLLIYCTGLSKRTSDRPFSSKVIENIKAKGAYGFDINAGFIGGLMGIHLACDILGNNPSFRNAVVASAQDFDALNLFGGDASRLQHMVFGDGGSAVVLAKNSVNNNVLSFSFIIDHYTNYVDDLLREGFEEESIVKKLIREMDITRLFKKTYVRNIMSKLTVRGAENTVRAIRTSLSAVNLEIQDIDHIVKTQLSLRETEILAKELKLNMSKFHNSSAEIGHLGSADILANLHYALKNEVLRNLEIIAILAANYDCSSGAIVIRR
jgi:3-oxoacyl-[acyl-carrier-protein] synthase-3